MYNEVDDIIGFKYNNEVYYYIKNGQNDIIGILDNNYNKIVEYIYDSWGNILEIKDNSINNIGIINPFRYRSYYYDNETKLYYLNSRYYNPLWGRFINCDGIIGANEDILSYNLYAYCSNNPVNMIDPDGDFVGALPALGLKLLKLFTKVVAVATTYSPSVALFTLGVVATVGIMEYAKSQSKAVTKSTTISKPQTQPIPKKSEDKHNVYTLSNKNSGKVEYVGRTKSIENATYRHHNNPARTHLRLDPVATDVSYDTARGLEQMLIIECRTINRSNPTNNQINSVSLKNLNYSVYWDAAETWKSENELPCR